MFYRLILLLLLVPTAEAQTQTANPSSPGRRSSATAKDKAAPPADPYLSLDEELREIKKIRVQTLADYPFNDYEVVEALGKYDISAVTGNEPADSVLMLSMRGVPQDTGTFHGMAFTCRLEVFKNITRSNGRITWAAVYLGGGGVSLGRFSDLTLRLKGSL